MNLQPQLHGEVETPRPLRMRDGVVTLTGWSLVAGQSIPPAVRLHTAAGIIPLAQRQPRGDVPRLLPAEPAAGDCGFVLRGRLRPGAYIATLQAQSLDGIWHNFKSLSLVVESPSLVATIEIPAGADLIHERVEVEGWALHPQQRVQALTLRYGHQSIPCDLGRPRPDLARTQADTPQAANAGFKSKTILSAGRGPLRLKARLADGSVALARTSRIIAIDEDENHSAALQLSADRIPLPGYGNLTPSVPARASQRRNILFVLYGNFTSNSALQVSALANELTAAGHSCAVAVPHDKQTLSHQLSPGFRALLHAEAIDQGGNFPDDRGPDFIHAWTTRENVRETSLAVQHRHGGRIIIQLEDNERQLLARQLDQSPEQLEALSDSALDARVPSDLSHPHRSREFLAAADGVTIIVDRLREFIPPGKPYAEIWPAADSRYFFPRPLPAEFRRALQLAPTATVLFYHGNTHAANADEVRELYAAVADLNEAGQPTVLIRAGIDSVDFLGTLAARVRPHVLELGQILNHRHLPPLMALADIFVQPGAPDAFNDYRFPSKLPEFFAIGRPVILPRTNLGLQLRHGTDAYVLDRADAPGIAAAITHLRRDPALAERLAQGAIAYSEKHFDWRRSAAALANFYQTLAPS